jgi:hypothetical protein
MQLRALDKWKFNIVSFSSSDVMLSFLGNLSNLFNIHFCTCIVKMQHTTIAFYMTLYISPEHW